METKLEISDFFKTTPKMTTIKLRQNKQQQQQQKMRDHDHYDQNERQNDHGKKQVPSKYQLKRVLSKR